MRRSQEEIDEAISLFNDKPSTENVRAVLDVLENELEYDEIEEKYQDENDPWLEQSALSALEFIDGDIELDEIS